MLGEPVSNAVTSDEDYETELEEILRIKEHDKQPDLNVAFGESAIFCVISLFITNTILF